MNYIVGLIFALLLMTSCTTPEKSSDNPEQAFSQAEEYEKAATYEQAIKKYQEVKNKFPYSQYAVKAELAVANVYYKSESYAEAQVHYAAFRDLHPTHSQMDYVTFQLAMSYYLQLPSTIDRDLTLANDSIKYFDEVLSKYKTSTYAADAADKRDKVIKMLADKEEYIADFYFKRQNYISALKRYEDFLKKYHNSPSEAKALARASYSALKLGDKNKAKNFKEQLLQRFPDSEFADFAKKEIYL